MMIADGDVGVDGSELLRVNGGVATGGNEESELVVGVDAASGVSADFPATAT